MTLLYVAGWNKEMADLNLSPRSQMSRIPKVPASAKSSIWICTFPSSVTSQKLFHPPYSSSNLLIPHLSATGELFSTLSNGKVQSKS